MNTNFKYCDFFNGKKINIMGLGILGRGIGVAKFLADCGAKLTITDLKTKGQLRSSLAKLKKYKNIKYIFGNHRLSDFRDKDMIIKAASVPLNSTYIKEARKNKIPVEMDASLFVKLAPAGVNPVRSKISKKSADLLSVNRTSNGVKIVGVTGTRGKSTVAHLIYEVFKKTGKKVFLGGNVKAVATLPLLKKISNGSGAVIVLELDSWQLQGFGDAKISPHIAVFTNFMPDHLNYYKGSLKRYFDDKASIFRYQNKDDFLIVGKNGREAIRKFFKRKIRSRIIISRAENVPKNWKIKILGKHNLENIAAAIAGLKTLGIEIRHIKKAVESFNGLPGRTEFIKEIKGVKYYNDTNATTPEAVIAGLEAFKKHKGKIILISGGADKNLDYNNYSRVVKKYVKAIILFKGTASEKIIKGLRIENQESKEKIKFFSEIKSMKEALKIATTNAERGDVVILSPGAASFGIFKNEYDRGEQFVKLLKMLL